MKVAVSFRRACVVLALAALPAAATAGFVTIASDNFDASAPGALAGNSGGAGWAGAWGSANPARSTVVGAAAADSPMAGNAVRFTGNSNGAATRSLASTQSGNVVVEFLFQFDTGTVSNNDFLGL